MATTTLSQYQRAEKLLPKLIKAHDAGTSISALATKHGLRREAVATVLAQNGHGHSSPERERVLAYVREHQGLSVDDLALQLDISKSSISRYLRGTSEHRLVVSRKQTDLSKFSDATMYAALRAAYTELGEDRVKGLSRVRYNKLKADGQPAASTFIRRYGSWSEACRRAGVTAAKPRRPSYEQEWTNEAIIEAVAEFVAETGTTTYHAYAAWAREHGRPSGPLLITRLRSWAQARRQALALVEPDEPAA
jgi:DNA-binding transcriptional ArsR family regulator